ncbi:hypothetical protein BKM88_00910 [Anaplasma marginale]|nr:hypothetical protein [Anaplasma marginale]AXW83828.1 hypothetical protein CQZ76_00925 [Anaplasma marginale]AXW84747.1 hypothetical protein BKM88_00910 [Anaplasma marginale]KAA8472117.1 hypothetical protein F0Q58_04510 [Anaplasma marginale]KAB0450770.1 hypothetical protein FY210_02975 [Anaplasma marginale]TZF78063.1 hypothetical protein FY180_03965 [Anaplasma marginale]
MGHGFTAYGMVQMGALLHLLQATAALSLLMSNYWLLGAECAKVAIIALSGLAVAMALLFVTRYSCLEQCVGGGKRRPVCLVQCAPMLYGLTNVVLSAMLLCSVQFSGVDFTGELTPGWMPTLCVALCFTLLSLWCARVVFRTLLALSGLCKGCLPVLNNGSNDLVGDVTLWVDEYASSRVSAPGVKLA